MVGQAGIWAAGSWRAAAAHAEPEKLGFHVVVKVPVPLQWKHARAMGAAERAASRSAWAAMGGLVVVKHGGHLSRLWPTE